MQARFDGWFRPVGRGFYLMRALAPAGEILSENIQGRFAALPKRKYPKRKAPGGLPATRVPCASRENRRMRNSHISLCEISSNRAHASSGFHCDARLRLRDGRTKPHVGKPMGVDLPSRSTHRVPQPIRGIAAHPVRGVVRGPRIGEERRGPA